MNKNIYTLAEAPIPIVDKDFLKDWVIGGAIVAPYSSEIPQRTYYDRDLKPVVITDSLSFQLSGRVIYPDGSKRDLFLEAYNDKTLQRLFIKITMDCRYFGFQNAISGVPASSYMATTAGHKAGDVVIPEWVLALDIKDVAGTVGDKVSEGIDNIAKAVTGGDDSKSKLVKFGIIAAIIIVLFNILF